VHGVGKVFKGTVRGGGNGIGVEGVVEVREKSDGCVSDGWGRGRGECEK